MFNLPHSRCNRPRPPWGRARHFLWLTLLLSGGFPALGGAATYTVSNCSDSGAGSLRQAITDANGNVGADVIDFSVACNGASAITLGSDPPDITEEVVIDACTAPGAVCGTSGGLISGTPLTLTVEIDVNGADRGLYAGASNITIRGFVINNGNYGVKLSGATDPVVEFNYIGTNVAGDSDLGFARDGIRISGTNGAVLRDNLITAGAVGDNAIDFQDGSGSLVTLNVIGLNATQSGALGGGDHSISLESLAQNVAIVQNHIANSGGVVEIDLGNDGYTGNDAGDSDSGANTLLNHPAITSATRGLGTTIVGTLDTDVVSTDFRIDVYANTPARRAAESFLGSFTVTTDGSGDATLNGVVSGCDASRDEITTTATRLDGSGNPLYTSELSTSVTATGTCITVQPVFYSVGSSTADLKTGTPNVTLSSGTATLTVAQADNVGVGDEITYDTTNKVYISGRTNATTYNVTTATGGVPADVTNATVNSIQRAFNSVSAAVVGSTDASHLNTADLVTANVQLNWPCYDDAPLDDVIDLDGYTTGTDNYIHLYAPVASSEVGVSQRHQGVAGTGFRLAPINSSPPSTFRFLTVRDDHFRMTGIEMDGSNVTNARSIDGIEVDFDVAADADIRFDALLMHDLVSQDGSGSDADVNGIQVEKGNVRISNTILYGLDQATANSSAAAIGILLQSSGTAHLHNNTVFDIKNTGSTANAFGVVGAGGTVTVRNTAVLDVDSTSGSEACFNGSFATESNNVSSDASATGATNQSSYASYFLSVTGGSENLHLLADSATLWGLSGADLDSDPVLPITVDIDGDARDATSPDIGADEFTGLPARDVYYSVGTDATDLKTGAPTITITAGSATFSVAQADNVGVGDEITYNTSTRVYISGRTSSTSYSVTTATGTVPADVTAVSVDSVMRAFNSLSGAEANAGTASYLGTTDLFGNNIRLHLACYDDGAMNDSVDIDGWTTGPDSYLRVFSPVTSSEVGVSQRHDGTAGTGFRLVPSLDVAGSSFIIVALHEEYVRLEGLELDGSNVVNAKNFRGISVADTVSATSDVRMDRMIVHDIVNSPYEQASSGAGLRFLEVNGGSLRLSNSLFYDLEQKNDNLSSFQHGIRVASSASGEVFIHNVTMFNVKNNVSTDSVYGISISGGVSPTVRNTVVLDVDGPGTAQCFSGTMTQSYNVASDTSASGTGSVTNQTAYTSYFIDTTNGSEDLHLKGDSNTLWGGYGLDLDSDPDLPITSDIDGEPRDASTPDIGADEFVATPGIELSLTLSDSPNPVNINETLTYTVSVANGGSLAATNVVMTDTLPGAVAFVGATGTGWACGEAAGVVTCTLPTLAAYTAAADITITVTAPGTAQSLSSSASVAAAEVDPVPGNNSDSENTLVIVPVPDLDQTHYRWRNDDGDETAGGGAPPLEVAAATDIDTSSASDVVVTGMTITPGAGDYLVFFTGSLQDADPQTRQYVSIYANGAKQAESEREILTESSIPSTSFTFASHALVSGLGDGQSIEARWRTEGGPATMHERTLTVVPIDPADLTESKTASDSTTTSASYTNAAASGPALPAVTVPSNGDYLAFLQRLDRERSGKRRHRRDLPVPRRSPGDPHRTGSALGRLGDRHVVPLRDPRAPHRFDHRAADRRAVANDRRHADHARADPDPGQGQRCGCPPGHGDRRHQHHQLERYGSRQHDPDARRRRFSGLVQWLGRR